MLHLSSMPSPKITKTTTMSTTNKITTVEDVSPVQNTKKNEPSSIDKDLEKFATPRVIEPVIGLLKRPQNVISQNILWKIIGPNSGIDESKQQSILGITDFQLKCIRKMFDSPGHINRDRSHNNKDANTCVYEYKKT